MDVDTQVSYFVNKLYKDGLINKEIVINLALKWVQ